MSMLSAGPPLESPRHPIGRQSLLLADPTRDGRLLGVDVWYPAATSGAELSVYSLMPGVEFLSAAAQHSQSLEALLCHIPGLKVVQPSNPYDMKGLMTACIRENNPTIMIKHKRLLGMQAEVPEERYEIPLGVANVLRQGSDVTVISWGRMVNETLAVAEKLAAEGIDVEVIDPRTLQPLDTATIVESVRKTNRAIVVHEAVRFGGLGAEITAQIQEEAFDYLDAPIGRVAAPFSPVPFTPVLEQAYLPSAAGIEAKIRAILARPGS